LLFGVSDASEQVGGSLRWRVYRVAVGTDWVEAAGQACGILLPVVVVVKAEESEIVLALMW